MKKKTNESLVGGNKKEYLHHAIFKHHKYLMLRKGSKYLMNLLVLLVGIMLLVNIFAIRDNPHHFVYTDDQEFENYDYVFEPVLNCSSNYFVNSVYPKVYYQKQKCAVVLMPYGKENVYLQESYPVLYWFITKQAVIIFLVIILMFCYYFETINKWRKTWKRKRTNLW